MDLQVIMRYAKINNKMQMKSSFLLFLFYAIFNSLYCTCLQLTVLPNKM